jgi:rRNA maturation protein Rpf1
VPYITFSKNFPEQAKLAKKLSKKTTRSIIEQRGSKSISKVVEIAASKGFKDVVIVIRDKNMLKAIKLSSKLTKRGLIWNLKKIHELENIEDIVRF